MTLTERIYDRYVSYEEIEKGFLQRKVTELVPRLEQFKADEFYRKAYPVKMGAPLMQRFINSLKEAGLDIGKGDSTFGYNMPLPPKKALERDLIIFRRK